MLDIIITHKDEPWIVGQKMFEMIKMQRGMEYGEIRVIFVQDGDKGSLRSDLLLKYFPFVGSVLTLPDGGVSRARNEGLRHADAEWVMFCDFDDCLYSIDSLYRICQSLRQAGDKADIVWSPIWIEMVGKDGKWMKQLKEWNTIFIHGKVYRRTWLKQNDIWFDEELCYSEDTYFNALCAMTVDPARVAKMPEVTYMWCFREGSASNYAGGEAARNLSLYRARVKTMEAYAARGFDEDAKCMAVRNLLDYYWELNGQDELAGHTKDEWVEMLRRDVIGRFPGAVTGINRADRGELFRVTKEGAKRKGLVRDGMPGPEEWLTKIGAII